jgi:hypothetical protein
MKMPRVRQDGGQHQASGIGHRAVERFIIGIRANCSDGASLALLDHCAPAEPVLPTAAARSWRSSFAAFDPRNRA